MRVSSTWVVAGGWGYARHGLESGVPLLEFHGVPGSRAYDLDAEALEADVDGPAAVGDGSAGQISEDGQPVA